MLFKCEKVCVCRIAVLDAFGENSATFQFFFVSSSSIMNFSNLLAMKQIRSIRALDSWESIISKKFLSLSFFIIKLSTVIWHLLIFFSLLHLQVAWIKSDSKAILAIHTVMVALNPRLSVTHNGHNTWKLHISHVELNDSGSYMCQGMITLDYHC